MESLSLVNQQCLLPSTVASSSIVLLNIILKQLLYASRGDSVRKIMKNYYTIRQNVKIMSKLQLTLAAPVKSTFKYISHIPVSITNNHNIIFKICTVKESAYVQYLTTTP